MAEFTAYEPNIEVDASLIKSYVDSNIRGYEKRLEIFKKFKIDLDAKAWYPQQQVLDCFKDISTNLGEMNLFLVGKTSLKTIKLPNFSMPQIIEFLNTIYHQSHKKNGERMFNPETNTFMLGIGGYSVISYKEKEKEMIVFANTPFSSKSDEGGIIGLLENNAAPHIKNIKIAVDTTQERRTLGADSCTYIITWQ